MRGWPGCFPSTTGSWSGKELPGRGGGPFRPCRGNLCPEVEDMPMDIKVDTVLDCKGLNCPLPVLKTKKAIDGMAVGQVLQMLSTDPGSKADMAAWTKRTGHELLDTKEESGVLLFFIKKTQ